MPEYFPEWFEDRFQRSAGATLLAHMKRELMQAVWMLLLDDDLLRAYTHGVRVTCADAIERLVFPRFFVYSADYPEK
jgi:hypothetical protein